MTLNVDTARAESAQAYARTHERLQGEPDYETLRTAAEHEARTAPQQWTARNRLAIHVELHMPLR
ncbi:hypothetical protein [Microbacterium paraoxydans]|uniref:hypothetical protein n=1 Tax=Microbacterium paraoxydans TaxID=199592 RepID=UPI003D7399AF